LRLIDLGVEPFLVSSAIIGVVAQRMVRRLCSHCAQPMEAPAEEALIYQQETGEERKEFLHGVGCKVCANSGYRGRTGIFEILCSNEHIKTLLSKNATAGEIREQAIKNGMVTLLQDGMLKVKKNITTPSEVIRNAYTVE
jgi:type II secretory ATPase GspE/PulE/Tfp pilus assembly ATPase PilB-like protein